MADRLRAVGYVRCSSLEQASEGMSLDAQRSRVGTWCEATGTHLLEVIEDGGVSGARALADRPGGARIVELLDARRPSVDAVVIVRLDRLGRAAAETLTYLRRFARGSVGLVSITDRIELSTPQGRAMAGMAAVFAELERALIGQRTADALATLRSQRLAYGPAPYGHDVIGGKLVDNAAEQAVIERIVRLRARGTSYDRIARALNRDGIPAKRGGKWHAMSVRSVVRTSAQLPAPRSRPPLPPAGLSPSFMRGEPSCSDRRRAGGASVPARPSCAGKVTSRRPGPSGSPPVAQARAGGSPSRERSTSPRERCASS